MKLTLNFEVGGQDIDWIVEFSPATSDTWDCPGDGPELEVTHAMLLTHLAAGKPQRMDILDLIVESAGGELPSHIDSALLELAEEGYSDARDSYDEDRAEALSEERLLRKGECDDL